LLNDQPGVLSARWAELHGGPHQDDANNKLVNQQLNGRSSSAYFICVLVLLRWPDDPVPLVAEGRWHGRWLSEARGEAGFGYDSHFLPDGQLQTAAEMPMAQKNSMSHRALAINRLIKQMLDLGLIATHESAGN
jgi:XTP/dITP diphosphohydrolase